MFVGYLHEKGQERQTPQPPACGTSPSGSRWLLTDQPKSDNIEVASSLSDKVVSGMFSMPRTTPTTGDKEAKVG